MTLVDFETAKVPCGTTDSAGGYVMANGEILRNRWSIVMAGIGRDGEITLIDPEGNEPLGLGLIGDALTGSREVAYAATREFDEMIAKGRFTNARRTHEPEPFFPAVPGADKLPWRNIGPGGIAADYPTYERGADCDSRDVPALLGYAPVGGGKKLPLDVECVMVHLLRDVVELILAAASPDAKCRAWCKRVLSSYNFAYDELFCGEPEA